MVCLAPAPDYNGVRRSLLLAGGGMRVAWQAGVLRALEEAGLSFFHGDGTSGGTMNLAMLMSGLSPQEMCDRWRTLKVSDFVSFQPPRNYLRAAKMSGMGDADGIVQKVFPHLGVDVQAIRQANGMAASFNVCNFSKKTNQAKRHVDVTLEHLVAGISLPIAMPAIKIGDDWYTDSVWIKDANIMEAVKRGAEEIWLLWCIGNTPEYKLGAFNQYVHMIEMSANGGLFEEFERVRELNERIERGETSPYGQRQPITLHVIKPDHELPLDPDLFLNRIDTATLIDMGYADAKAALTKGVANGVDWLPEATTMLPTGVEMLRRQRLSGKVKSSDGKFALIIEMNQRIFDVEHFNAEQEQAIRVTAHISCSLLGESQVSAASGSLLRHADGAGRYLFDVDTELARYRIVVHVNKGFYEVILSRVDQDSGEEEEQARGKLKLSWQDRLRRWQHTYVLSSPGGFKGYLLKKSLRKALRKL